MVDCCVTVGGRRVEVKTTVFSGGELHVVIPSLPRCEGDVEVFSRVQTAQDLFELALVKEIVDRVSTGRKCLMVPYLPYARQDRVTAPESAFSLKVAARFINSLGFDEVRVCDPHSDVTPALIERVVVESQAALCGRFRGMWDALAAPIRETEGLVIVAPDAGAVKKAGQLAASRQVDLVVALKHRDVQTGAISGTKVCGDVRGKACLVVDDICDGGRTFTELGSALREAGAARVYLYVTHGIFSRGLSVFEGIIDGIFTTDSFKSVVGNEVPITYLTIQLNN